MKMQVKKDKKGNIENIILTDVYLYYCNVRKPKAIYDDRKLPYEKARKEYCVDIGINEEIADEWDEIFGKQPSKKHKNDKFRETYKLDDEDALPVPDATKQFTIKSVQRCEKKDGSEIHPKMIPRVFMTDPETNKLVDHSFTTNVGNGSVGNVLIRVNVNDFGAFAYLNKIKVTDLVPYEDSGSGISEDEAEFLGTDDVELAEVPEKESKPSSDSDSADDFADDDVPFDSGEEDADY